MRDETAVALQRALKGALPRGWRESAPWGYPQQAELAVIAGVFAAQVPQATADEVAASYMMARPGRMLDDLGDLANVSAVDLSAMLGDTWGSSRVLGVARTRVEVILEVAQVLVGAGVRRAREYRDMVADDSRAVDEALQGIRGLGGVSSEAISTMMQAEHRPGPVVVDYVRALLGEQGAAVADDELIGVLPEAARRLTVEPRVLLYALWRMVALPHGSDAAYVPQSVAVGPPGGST